MPAVQGGMRHFREWTACFARAPALPSGPMDMRATLEAELNRRRQRNPRYSLRAFAQAMRTHHSTLSQILQSRRRLTPRSIQGFGARLGLTPAQIHEACVAENCAAIRRLVGDPRFRPDS